MNLRQAIAADEPLLSQFFSSSLAGSGLELHETRPKGFFSKYHLGSKDSTTYILEDTPGEILGTATMTFVNGAFEGKPQTIGYASDLRIAPTRRAILAWTQQFNDVFQEICTQRQCERVFSTVLKNQTQAANALLRPRNQRRNLPRYCLYRNFSVHAVFGKWPLPLKGTPALRVRPGTESDINRIFNYLYDHREQNLHFPYFRNAETFNDFLNHWPGFSWDSFHILHNSKDDWFGVWYEWNPGLVFEWNVLKLQGRMELLGHLLRWLALPNWRRAKIHVGKFLSMKWILFCRCQNPDNFNEIIRQALTRTQPPEFLVMHSFEEDQTKVLDSHWISAELKGGLYGLIEADKSPSGSFFHSPTDRAPLWELPLI